MILTILFTILHVLVSLFLILVVLAQQGKGQDLASAFGGAGSQTAFGARGTATLLSKITAGAAAVFMITSLALSYLRPAVSERSVIPADAPAPPTETSAPSTPGEPAATEPAPATEAPATPTPEAGAPASPASHAGGEATSTVPPPE